MKHKFPSNGRVSVTLSDNGVAQVRLTRPEKLNALDPAMFDALLDAGQALYDFPGLRCVLLCADGPGFCAGIDIAAFEPQPGDDGIQLPDRTHGNANRFQQAAMQWRKLPVPVVAAVDGVCFGGGLQIAAGADIRVTSAEARFSIMEMRWGVVPDMGGFALWRGAVRDDILRELTYTNREFSGVEAVRFGFATILDEDPLARAALIAQEIAARSPSAIRCAKTLFNRYLDLTVDKILMEESLTQQRLFGTRNQLEAVRSQLEGRPPSFVDP